VYVSLQYIYIYFFLHKKHTLTLENDFSSIYIERNDHQQQQA
jgi:hypothetical protein